MDDLPTENGNGTETNQQDNPLFKTLEAMKRLKERNETLEETVKNIGIVVSAHQVRIKNLEDAFQVACKGDIPGPLKEHFDKLKANENDESSESEEEETEVKEETPEASIGESEESD